MQILFRWKVIVTLVLTSYALGYSRVPITSIVANALRGALQAIEAPADQ